jgi:uncharacterized protein (TIGR03084 family)
MAADLPALVDDLVAESAALDVVLDGLLPAQWSLPTPAAGWTVRDQVSHLAYFDGATLQSLVDPERFRQDADALKAGGDNISDCIAAAYHSHAWADLLSWFRAARAALVSAYRTVDAGRRLPWYGPDMTPASSVSARLMETWAHGQDIVDAIGADRVATRRLRHVADLGIRAMPYSYAVNHLVAPADPIRVELNAPEGDQWSWGSADAVNRVSGEAAPRRHRHSRDGSDCAAVDLCCTGLRWPGRAWSFPGCCPTMDQRVRVADRSTVCHSNNYGGRSKGAEHPALGSCPPRSW